MVVLSTCLVTEFTNSARKPRSVIRLIAPNITCKMSYGMRMLRNRSCIRSFDATTQETQYLWVNQYRYIKSQISRWILVRQMLLPLSSVASGIRTFAWPAESLLGDAESALSTLVFVDTVKPSLPWARMGNRSPESSFVHGGGLLHV
jgi:hypothetical protein